MAVHLQKMSKTIMKLPCRLFICARPQTTKIGHPVGVLQYGCFNLLFSQSSPSISPLSCSISHWPRFLLSLVVPSSHSLGCVWWTAVIISTSFMRPSSKKGGDCIYQALACLRDALGCVALNSEESSVGTSELGWCVYVWLTGSKRMGLRVVL